MKAAIYINQGTTQVVLTPESKWEREALNMIEGSATVQTFWGHFYECRGGWFREGINSSDERSLMFRINMARE